MAILPSQAPLPIYGDLDGSPLDNGYIYFGTVNLNPETAPKTVYWDLAGTQPVAQPVRTLNGYAVRNGTPARIYISGEYSLTVKDVKLRRVVYLRNAADGAQIVNDSIRGDLISTDAGLGFNLVSYTLVAGETGVVNPQYAPGVAERYGCNEDAECSAEVQNWLDSIIGANLEGVGTGIYQISSTVYFRTGAAPAVARFRLRWNELDEVDRRENSSRGFLWVGASNSVAVEINEIRGSCIDFLGVYNDASVRTGCTAVLIRNRNNAGTSINNNKFGLISIAGFLFGMRIGQMTNAGYPAQITADAYNSNFDDNTIDELCFYDVANPLLIDSAAQDNLRIKKFHNGGPATANGGPTDAPRDFIIRAIDNGIGFRIDHGFSRVDDITADNDAIDIRGGDFECGFFGFEGGGTCRVLNMGDTNSRTKSVINRMTSAEGIFHTSNEIVRSSARSGIVMIGCAFGDGNVTATREVVAIDTLFKTGFGFVESGNAGHVEHIGTKTRTDTTLPPASSTLTGVLTLQEAKTTRRSMMESARRCVYECIREFTTGILVDNTDIGIVEVDIGSDNSGNGGHIFVDIDYHLYSGSTTANNASVCGTVRYAGCMDSSGNITLATPTVVNEVKALDGFASCAITATATSTAATASTAGKMLCKFNQNNDVGTAFRGLFHIKIIGSTAGANNCTIDPASVNLTV